MTTEAGLWKWLKQVKRQLRRDDLHIDRVENSVGAGFPDVEGMLDTIWFGIELKVNSRPAHETTPIKVKVRDSQIKWHPRRRRAGGLCWFLCQVGEGHQRKLYLIPGDYAQELLDGMCENELRDLSRLKSSKPSQIDVIMRAIRAP